MNRVLPRALMIGFAVIAMKTAPALAVVGGSATYASQQNGGSYSYNLQLKNTGDTALKTFWFSWAPFGSFLPNVPDTTGSPAGWGAQVVQDYYGTSILWNSTGAGLAPGASLAGFTFSSVDSPATLAGNDYYYGYYPVTLSYAYASTVNPTDALPGQFGVFTAAPGAVPEPGCAGLLIGAGAAAGLRRRRK